MYYRHNISRNMICKYLILVTVLLFMYICESKMHKYNDMRYITRYFFLFRLSQNSSFQLWSWFFNRPQ